MGLRVLYLHMSGGFGGSSRSLVEFLRAMPPGSVEALIVTQRGTVSPYFREVAKDLIETAGMTQFDHTRYSHYRGLRWLLMIREIAYLPATIFGLIRARLRWRDIDLIHLNEVTGLVPLILARALFRRPAVVHVRALLQSDPHKWRSRVVRKVLARSAASVIAIDENVKASVYNGISVHVIHNGFSPRPLGYRDENLAQSVTRAPESSFRVGFVGTLLMAKGLLDLVEAARLLRERGRRVEFLVLGENPRRLTGLRRLVLERAGVTQDVRTALVKRIELYGLKDSFRLLGFSLDLELFYRSIDVVCFPSHLDAPGRPVLEAAYFGVPAIVAVRSPRPDTLIPGKTGLAIPPRDAAALAAAIEELVDHPERVRSMGYHARELAARNFDSAANAVELLGIYQRIVQDAASSSHTSVRGR